MNNRTLIVSLLRNADPLFVDPYADCFVPPNTSKDADQDFHPYCLATKFIDDKLLWAVSRIDGFQQVITNYKLVSPDVTFVFRFDRVLTLNCR